MSNKLRWGVLGTGGIAKKFAGDLKATDLGELVATGSGSQLTGDVFASEFGGKGVESYEALVSDHEEDAVYNSLPILLHAEWSIKAM